MLPIFRSQSITAEHSPVMCCVAGARCAFFCFVVLTLTARRMFADVSVAVVFKVAVRFCL